MRNEVQYVNIDHEDEHKLPVLLEPLYLQWLQNCEVSGSGPRGYHSQQNREIWFP